MLSRVRNTDVNLTWARHVVGVRGARTETPAAREPQDTGHQNGSIRQEPPGVPAAGQRRSQKGGGKTTDAPELLSVKAGLEPAKYPQAIVIPANIKNELELLQSDADLPQDLCPQSASSRMERAGVILRSGILKAISKQRHIELLGCGRARESSPSDTDVRAHLEKEGISEKEMAISVHTHPGRSAPSSTDIANVAATRSSLGERSIIVNDIATYFMIATKTTGDTRKSWGQTRMRQQVSYYYEQHRPNFVSEDLGLQFQYSTESRMLAAAASVFIAVYKNDRGDTQFRLIREAELPD